MSIKTAELRSSVSPRDPMTQPFRVVLHNMGTAKDPNWVTHFENLIEVEKAKKTSFISFCGRYSSKAIPDFYWGHYYGKDYNTALADYWERCAKYKLA